MSVTILEEGKAAAWRIKLVNSAIEQKDDGEIYQQSGFDLPCVMHSCRKLGEPFDSARYRSAKAMWDAVEDMSAPKNKEDRAKAVARLKGVWQQTG